MRAAVMVDLEKDGRMEVVAAVERADDVRTNIRVLQVGDDGEISSSTRHWLARVGLKLVAGEFDGDGVADVVVYSAELGLVLLRGADGFGVGEKIAGGMEGMLAVGVTDGDGDGIVDLFVQTDLRVWLLRGLGDGTFAERRAWLRARGERVWAFGDVDRDRRIDAVTIGGALLSLWTGVGGPRALLDGVSATALVDLDGDGQLEVLAAGGDGEGEGTLYVGRSGGDGVFAFSGLEMEMVRPKEMIVEDWDGDGLDDVVVVDPARGMTFMRRGK